jgi:hypothetical protein
VTIVRKKYTRIDQLFNQVNDDFATYLRNLMDLHTYLNNDLNFPALQTAQPWLNAADKNGETLRAHLNGLITELGETTNILSPVPVPQRLDSSTLPERRIPSDVTTTRSTTFPVITPRPVEPTPPAPRTTVPPVILSPSTQTQPTSRP